MLTSQQFQIFNRTGHAVSPATCIETLYFEQSYNGLVYRTSLNNRLLVTGNKMNSVNKNNIQDALNRAEIPFYYITKINSDTASGLYRLDVSLYSINNAVKATAIINDLSTRIDDTSTELARRITDCSLIQENHYNAIQTEFLKKTGGRMSAGIVFGSKDSSKNNTELPGITYNGNNLIFACPTNGYISLWGLVSEEYTMNNNGIRIQHPDITENGKVPVFNYSTLELVWSTYNAGSLQYSTADYSKYYILGITEQSYAERTVGEHTFIATEGNIETNVYVHRKNVYANAFYQSSDIELKTDVKPIEKDTYIPKVVQFKWLDTSQLSYGFIALDLEEHGLTELMDKDDNNRWRVNYSATLSLAVGDLQTKYDNLKHELDSVKDENMQLKETLKALTEKVNKLESLIK